MLTLSSTGKTAELSLNNYQWTCRETPKVHVSLDMQEQGLHVLFTVEEKDPVITAKVQQEPMLMVCQDSAVEVFLAFADSKDNKDFVPKLEHCLYTNIEINAQGICYAKHGHSRKNRTAYTKEEIARLGITTKILDDHWTCELIVPRDFIAKLAGYDAFAPDSVWAFNLYKISESSEHEHYVSYHKIDNATPNFHLPEYFELCSVRQ